MSNDRPVHKHMESAVSRTRSFVDNGWPQGSVVQSYRLVQAGFFYRGQNDSVECFHCGIELNRWSAFDVPHENHARHSPDCEFIRQNFFLTAEDFDVLNSVAIEDDLDQRDDQDLKRALYSLQTYRDTVAEREAELREETSALRVKCAEIDKIERQMIVRMIRANALIIKADCQQLLHARRNSTDQSQPALDAEDGEGESQLVLSARRVQEHTKEMYRLINQLTRVMDTAKAGPPRHA